MVRILLPFILLSTFIWTVLSKVYVYSPKELIDKVKLEKGNNDGFEISLANFGVIPYGHSLIGKLYYDPENQDGCKKFEDFEFTEENVKDQQTPIILVYRGNCTFVKKIRNIEHAGGRLGIVIEKKLDDISSVIMSDDGTGMSINIPSFLIGKTDGDMLIEYITDNGKLIPVKDSKNTTKDENNESGSDRSNDKNKGNKANLDDEDENTSSTNKKNKEKDEAKKNEKTKEKKFVDVMRSASLYVNFELPNPDQRVEYDIWYSSIDNRALDFISDFQKYDEKLDEMVLMTPHFVTWKCNNWEESMKKKECFGNGKYCAIQHSKESKISGQEIILEDLREKCIYSKTYDSDRKIFWKYIKEVHDSCPGYINEDCSKSAHQKLGIDFNDIMDWVKKSFKGKNIRDYEDDNTVLEDERIYWNDYGAHFYPSIVVNNRTYRGAFDSEAVFGSLCAGFKSPPSVWDNELMFVKGVTANTITVFDVV